MDSAEKKRQQAEAEAKELEIVKNDLEVKVKNWQEAFVAPDDFCKTHLSPELANKGGLHIVTGIGGKLCRSNAQINLSFTVKSSGRS